MENQNKEISLGGLIKKTIEYIKFVLHPKRVWLIFLIAFPIAFYMYKKTDKVPTLFKANLSFALTESGGGGGADMNQLMSQFGFGGGSSVSVDLQRMLELLKTRKIISKALFTPIEIDGEVDFMANHYIEIFDLHAGWATSESMKGFLFKHDKIDSFSRTENSVIKKLHGRISGQLSSRVSESGIVTLVFMSTSEKFSYEFLSLLFHTLETHYVEQTLQKQIETFETMKIRRDSVSTELSRIEVAWARTKDSRRGIFLNEEQLTPLRLERDVERLQLMHVETIRNVEMARMSLANKKPFVHLIDPPILPLPIITSNARASAKIGLLVGLLLGIIVLVLWKFGSDILKEEKAKEQELKEQQAAA